eukprot:scaffold342792_cov11-Prasinocladus_malaysianus.AAC.1
MLVSSAEIRLRWARKLFVMGLNMVEPPPVLLRGFASLAAACFSALWAAFTFHLLSLSAFA